MTPLEREFVERETLTEAEALAYERQPAPVRRPLG